MQQTIKYKGITRIPSDHDSFNGEMEEMYNLINTNGELKPVVDPDTIGTLSGRFIFVHKNAGYEHFITIDGIYIKAYNYASGTITSIGNITSIYGETLRKIESVGNTLIVITDKEIKYVLWKDNQYKYIGNIIPFPIINFGFTITRLSGYNVTLQLDEYEEYITYLRRVTGYYGGRSSIPRAPSSEIKTNFENVVLGKINSILDDIIESKFFIFPFFIRYALRLYDGSLINHSMPLLMLPTKFVPFEAGINDTGNNVMIYFPNVYNLTYSNAAIDFSQFKDIVQSVDVFISEPIYTYLYDGEINGTIENPFDTIHDPDLLFGGIYKANDLILEEISSVGNFYKLLSIPIGDLNTAVSSKIINDNYVNIVNNERMMDDYLSMDKITAENSYVYNNKLHLSGIERRMFTGFKIGETRCYYYGAQDEAQISIGNQSFLFYPGKCNKVLLSRYTRSGYIENILDLKKHPRLNGYYYIDPNLNPIESSGTATSQSILEATINSNKTVIEESDKLYVSAHQNPFYFPVEQRITLPVGRIIAMSSNTEAISQGQFGQFPLYVFTDDGIWALEMNSEGKYMIRQPVSREVCVNPNILQMDNAVAFISKKGITILSGAETECISDIIKDNNTRSSKLDINSFIVATQSDELQQVYQTDDIGVFLEGCNMAYEYLNGIGRLYAINSNYKYAYVFDILSRTWSKVKADYISQVNNYPDCYVQSPDGTIKNLSTIGSDTSPIKTFFITRAIKYEDVLFSLTHIAHRGIFKSVLNTVIYASRDGINYTPIYSDKKNIMKISGSPFRYYKIAVIASLDPKDTVSGVDISFEPRYMNRLR